MRNSSVIRSLSPTARSASFPPRICGRQHPYAVGMIGGVARIGVDLARLDEFEAVRLDEADHVALAHVALVAVGIARRRPFLRAVLDDAEHPVIGEQIVDARELFVKRARTVEIVHLAEDQHPVDIAHIGIDPVRARGGDGVRRAGKVPAGRLLAIIVGQPLEIGREALVARGGGVGGEADIVPFGPQIGHQHARVPAGGGHVVGHRHARFDPEEGERLGRVAVGVARPVLGAARIGERLREHRGIDAGALLSGGGGSGQRQGAGGSGERGEDMAHERSPVDRLHPSPPPADDKRFAASYIARPKETKMAQEQAIVAGGCFWCTEAVFKDVVGVTHVESGYIGGETTSPTYREVCSGRTGHAEAVRVSYDPEALSYAELLDMFLGTHDPTQLNRQGNDVGTQYRSAIFPLDAAQEAEARAAIERWNAAEGKRAATTIEGFSEGEQRATWYPAEESHQDYWEREGQRNPYCQATIPPKLMKLRKSFGGKVKENA